MHARRITAEALRHWLTEKNLSQVALAEMSGVAPNYISQLATGKRAPSMDILLQITDALELSVAEFFSRQSPEAPEFYMVPKVGARPLAGSGGLETDSNFDGWYAFRQDFLFSKGNPDSMRLFSVNGQSMEPVLQAGDMVLVDLDRDEVRTDKIYLLRLGEQLMVKRLELRERTLLIKSDNPAYETMTINPIEDDVQVFGQMIWSCREY